MRFLFAEKIKKVTFCCFVVFLLSWGKTEATNHAGYSFSFPSLQDSIKDTKKEKTPSSDSVSFLLPSAGISPQSTPESDSIVREPLKNDSIKPVFYGLPNRAVNWFKRQPSSTYALMCCIIPGGGQIYNKKYWKVPIVWGIGAGCAYYIGQNQSKYKEYHTAYRDFMSEDNMQFDSWKGFVPPGQDPARYTKDANIKSRLKNGTTLYRRNRDFSIIVSCLVYLIVILDAYVDAEMADYDISPNLSLWQGTTPSATGRQSPVVGLQYKITF